MELEAVEVKSIASGAHNEDRAGVAFSYAWVIDGATDVLPEPLTDGPTDAAWFADAMQDAIARTVASTAVDLRAAPEIIAHDIAPRFVSAARRPAAHRGEHPSASAIILRAHQHGIEYVSLGDCTLMIEQDDTLAFVGVDADQAGDRWVVDALRGNTGKEATAAPLSRADLLPQLRAQRQRMNTPGGYGIFSITAPPSEMIGHGTFEVRDDARILLASDGIMRLCDVFHRYDAQSLFEAAWTHGLAPLLTELRALEAADDDCRRFPRAKTSDDATALLLRYRTHR